LDQILVNLCVNARDAIGDVGRVSIETAPAVFDEDYCARHPGAVLGDYVKLAIRDSGCGMDPETVAHIFEPFFSTKREGEGIGLGLATVYGIVRQNNGQITVHSVPGAGTVFTLFLPRHAESAETGLPPGAESPPPAGRETVLVAEDESAHLNMTCTMLRRQGYTVLAAGTPGEALRLAREHPDPIDLLLTDVIMPEMNGRDLARKLEELRPGIRRVFMSGYTADVIAHHGVLSPDVLFIQKPFTMKGLADKLRDALRRRPD
ncbi:MAG TPA: ATP-binding protein, partial [Candidatus Hydrogenedentes bacterium]|nr:ATP-binding protein [Candidatus Hydrogenedentota bacterium]